MRSSGCIWINNKSIDTKRTTEFNEEMEKINESFKKIKTCIVNKEFYDLTYKELDYMKHCVQGRMNELKIQSEIDDKKKEKDKTDALLEAKQMKEFREREMKKRNDLKARQKRDSSDATPANKFKRVKKEKNAAQSVWDD